MNTFFRLLRFLLISWLLVSGQLTATAQSTPAFLWATASGGPGDDFGWHSALDAAGNTYAAGSFSGTATFQSATLVSRGGTDVFLAKYNPQGKLLWLRQLGGPGEDQVATIAVDAASNVVITGNFIAGRTPSVALSMTIGSFTLPASNAKGELYLAKYDAQGSALWARQSTSVNGIYNYGLALTSSGDMYLLAAVASPGPNTAQLDQLTVVDSFLAKYSAQGTIQWVKQGLGTLRGIAVDATGYLYLYGSSGFATSLILGTLTLPANSFYFGRFDALGNVIWAQQLVGTGPYYEIIRLAVGPNQNLLLTEEFQGATTHGSQTFTANGYADIFTGCYSPQGNFLWGKQLGSPSLIGGADQICGPVVDAAGNTYIVAMMYGMPTLTGYSGPFIPYFHLVSYSPIGALRWTRTLPDYVTDMSASATGEVAITGFLERPRSFDSFPLTSNGGQDIYVAKLAASPDLAPPPAPPVPVPAPPVPVPVPVPPVLSSTIPNVITPNGDGLNDKFALLNLPPGPWQLRIYSRWGQEVYHSDAYQQDWAAAGQPAGVYYYLLQRLDQEPIKGWVEVVR